MRGQWFSAVFVPGYSDGPVADFHGIPFSGSCPTGQHATSNFSIPMKRNKARHPKCQELNAGGRATVANGTVPDFRTAKQFLTEPKKSRKPQQRPSGLPFFISKHVTIISTMGNRAHSTWSQTILNISKQVF
jgi:hypothetical protein